MVADVTIGFVKDAKHHVDVQGFNVYHRNRLIKVPFYVLSFSWLRSYKSISFSNPAVIIIALSYF